MHKGKTKEPKPGFYQELPPPGGSSSYGSKQYKKHRFLLTHERIK